MASLATARMSAKGHILIPGSIRRQLGLRAGSEFVVLNERGTIILKMLATPSARDLDSLLVTARRQARKAGLKRSDLRSAIRRARRRA